jgi:hypothetical protein
MKTIQGTICKACNLAFKAIGYYKRSGTIVYRCGCEPVLISCETKAEFKAANGREIKRKWG